MDTKFIRVPTMAFLRLLRGRKAVPPAPKQLRCGPFDRLPLEIIQYIASFLPTNSAAAFAFCNHTFREVLGAKYWNLLRFSPSRQTERAIFLQWLERELPEYIFCDCCAKLHSPCGPREVLEQRQCFIVDFRQRQSSHYRPEFRYDHVQMAMKLHRLGRDTRPDLARLTLVDTATYGPNDLYLSEARIVADEMFVRAQHWLLVPGNKFLHVPKFSFRVCHHLDTLDLSPNNKLKRMMFCKIAHLNDMQKLVSCKSCNGLSQCDYCPTEFQVDLKSFGDRGTAVVITKWMNLGAGYSRSDPKWRSHLTDLDKDLKRTNLFRILLQHAPSRRLATNGDGPIGFKPGSIRSAFEQNAEFAFESLLTAKSASKLLGSELVAVDSGSTRSNRFLCFA